MVTDNQVMEALTEVIDPDIHMNIVDLGLVYSVDIDDTHVTVVMTLTTPACPVGPQLMAAAEAVVKKLDDVDDVTVNLVWEPTWNPSMMSDVAKLELGYEID
jgi:metal-sulfur cluster biosynthetic enzyme